MKIIINNFLFYIYYYYFIIPSTLSLNILGIFPHTGRSQFVTFEPLLKELVERGHDLTVISNFFYINPLVLSTLADESCNKLNLESIKQFVKDEREFDLILIEMFNSNCFLGFVHKYKVPFIGLSACTILPWLNQRFGNPSNPSYIPVIFSPHTDHMSFFERVENLLIYIYSQVIYEWKLEEKGHEIARKIFGDDLPPFRDLAKNASLFFVNTHLGFNYPRALVPNIIEIGGIHIKEPKKLPQNIETFIENSSGPVIYFSMGTVLKGYSIAEEARKIFQKVFAKMNVNILWKWENVSLPGKSDNIMIQTWMPQSDILCHPNVTGFISHGGLLGLSEAVYCGVPAIVIPQFGDQFLNAKMVEANGIGVVLNMHDITEETLLTAMKTILKTEVKKRAETLSKIFRDRPSSQHGGASFMRTKAIDMPLYQYLLLDVLLFLFTILVIILMITYFMIKILISKYFAKHNVKLKTG